MIALLLALVAGAVGLLALQVHWPVFTVYLTGLRLGYRLSESEYDKALMVRLLDALSSGVEDDRFTARQREVLQICIGDLEEGETHAGG